MSFKGFVFHTALLAWTCYITYWIFTCVPDKPPIDNIVQLTTINTILIVYYYFSAAAQDVANWFSDKIHEIEFPYGNGVSLIYQTVFSLSHLVAVAYWALRLYDITLVVPANELGAVSWQSYWTHGINTLVLYLEVFLFKKKIPYANSYMLIHFSLFTVFYVFLQYLYHELTGKQVYPFLQALPIWAVGAFYLTLYLFMLGIFFVGKGLVHHTHRTHHAKHKVHTN